MRFAICNLNSLLALTALLAIAWYFGAGSSRADEARTFWIEQAKDRTGRGSFPHDQKEHVKVQCADCHLAAKENPRNTDQPMAKDFPHTACIRCHNFAAEFFKAAMGQGSRFCGVCHEPRRISRSDKALRPGVFPRPQISEFEDAFSHKAHRRALPADFRIMPISNPPYGSQFKPGDSPRCTDCHQQIKQPAPQRGGREDNKPLTIGEALHNQLQTFEIRSRSVKGDFRTEKGHAACFVCHGRAPSEPRSVSAETFPYANDCKVCHELHTSGMAPRAVGLFGSIKDFRHDDHDIDIRPKKKSDFPLPTAPDRLCSECHKPIDQVEVLGDIKLPLGAYCDTCHINNKPGLPGRLSDTVLNKLRRD